MLFWFPMRRQKAHTALWFYVVKPQPLIEDLNPSFVSYAFKIFDLVALTSKGHRLRIGNNQGLLKSKILNALAWSLMRLLTKTMFLSCPLLVKKRLVSFLCF
jgi:hypothetical protein